MIADLDDFVPTTSIGIGGGKSLDAAKGIALNSASLL